MTHCPPHKDVIIIGAGAAGLMCAIEAGKRGRTVLLIDHAKMPAEKIRISGGGRCNFTNIHTTPANYLSQNPRFCISALKRYTPKDFIELVESYNIAYHEKTLGQLFCDHSAKDIISMLLQECKKYNVEIHLNCSVSKIEKNDIGFDISTSNSPFSCQSLVVACGGKSIPKMGSTGFGYEIAKQFNITRTPIYAALVPFTFEGNALEYCKNLAGTAFPTIATVGKSTFSEAALFTHRGMSGPAILQISSYWKEKQHVTINHAPSINCLEYLLQQKRHSPKQNINTALAGILPKKLATAILTDIAIETSHKLADMPNKTLQLLAQRVNAWQILPNGTEGYRTAEVTAGGIDTNELSSKTFESKKVAGLYFIGEVVDVTGHLGGFNFQWAWSSGYCAGQYA